MENNCCPECGYCQCKEEPKILEKIIPGNSLFSLLNLAIESCQSLNLDKYQFDQYGGFIKKFGLECSVNGVDAVRIKVFGDNSKKQKDWNDISEINKKKLNAIRFLFEGNTDIASYRMSQLVPGYTARREFPKHIVSAANKVEQTQAIFWHNNFEHLNNYLVALRVEGL